MATESQPPPIILRSHKDCLEIAGRYFNEHEERFKWIAYKNVLIDIYEHLPPHLHDFAARHVLESCTSRATFNLHWRRWVKHTPLQFFEQGAEIRCRLNSL